MSAAKCLNGLLLGLKAKARGTLLVCRNSVVSDVLHLVSPESSQKGPRPRGLEDAEHRHHGGNLDILPDLRLKAFNGCLGIFKGFKADLKLITALG
jgi:hypothetical protein